MHFLHNNLTYIESIGIEGKNGVFHKFLADKGICVKGEYWNSDHSTIDWNKITPHFQFQYDYKNNEVEIKNWLKQSDLKKHEFLYTWLSWEDPIIKIRTSDFIENWIEFNITTAYEGLRLTTENGELFLEFTDDWKYHLNSNFEIKIGSIQECKTSS